MKSRSRHQSPINRREKLFKDHHVEFIENFINKNVGKYFTINDIYT